MATACSGQASPGAWTHGGAGCEGRVRKAGAEGPAHLARGGSIGLEKRLQALKQVHTVVTAGFQEDPSYGVEDGSECRKLGTRRQHGM